MSVCPSPIVEPKPRVRKSLIMASYQSVVNINIIMKFLIGHKAFVSLGTTLPYIIDILLNEHRRKTLYPEFAQSVANVGNHSGGSGR